MLHFVAVGFGAFLSPMTPGRQEIKYGKKLKTSDFVCEMYGTKFNLCIKRVFGVFKQTSWVFLRGRDFSLSFRTAP
jgi:hypothetical protein